MAGDRDLTDYAIDRELRNLDRRRVIPNVDHADGAPGGNVQPWTGDGEPGGRQRDLADLHRRGRVGDVDDQHAGVGVGEIRVVAVDHQEVCDVVAVRREGYLPGHDRRGGVGNVGDVEVVDVGVIGVVAGDRHVCDQARRIDLGYEGQIERVAPRPGGLHAPD